MQRYALLIEKCSPASGWPILPLVYMLHTSVVMCNGTVMDSGVHAKLSGHSRWAVGRMATLRSALPKGRTCREVLPQPLAVVPRAAVNIYWMAAARRGSSGPSG